MFYPLSINFNIHGSPSLCWTSLSMHLTDWPHAPLLDVSPTCIERQVRAEVEMKGKVYAMGDEKGGEGLGMVAGMGGRDGGKGLCVVAAPFTH